MSNIQKIGLIDFGPQVVFIDNTEQDTKPLENAFNDLNISNRFIEVNYIEPNYPKNPLPDVKLVFLDLFLNDAFAADFDPYACAEWLKRVVPDRQKYSLIIWSKDVEKAADLLKVIEELNITYPVNISHKSKPEYLKPDIHENMNKMLDELGIKLKESEKDVQEFYGKILEIEENSVLINCLINDNPKVFEIRRFDLKPFRHYIDLKPEAFIRFKITTKPGSRTIDFESEENDLSDNFIKPDDADDFGNIEWLNTPE